MGEGSGPGMGGGGAMPGVLPCGVPGVSPWLPLGVAHFNYTLEVKVVHL